VLLVALWRTQQSRLEEVARAEAHALAALLLIVLVASGLFAWLIGRRIAGAIHAEVQAADAVTSARLAAAEGGGARPAGELDGVPQQERAARLQAEAANRAKDEFLAMLGHELRNPLGAIGGAMRVLERLPASSGDHKAARDIIARQSAHLAKIVDDLLDVGRLVNGRLQLRPNVGEVGQASSGAVASVRAAEREGEHEWTLELAPVLVSADLTRIDQVLANLLGNAAKFTPSGGRIHVRLAEQAGEAILTVEDSGPGVRPDLLPHVFELFSRD